MNYSRTTTTGFETPVQRPLFNKVANPTTWRLSTALVKKRLSRRHFFVNFEKFLGKVFLQNTSLATTSDIMLFFSFLQIIEVCSLKSFFWWTNGRLGGGNHKLVHSSVVMEIRWKLHCQLVATHIPTKAFQQLEK